METKLPTLTMLQQENAILESKYKDMIQTHIPKKLCAYETYNRLKIGISYLNMCVLGILLTVVFYAIIPIVGAGVGVVFVSTVSFFMVRDLRLMKELEVKYNIQSKPFWKRG